MTYDDFGYPNGNSPMPQQADLERIVRRALRANSGRSDLARRILDDAAELSAAGLARDSAQLIREIACRLSRDMSREPAPRYAPTLVGSAGTVLVA